jgi:hypothetical protein
MMILLIRFVHAITKPFFCKLYMINNEGMCCQWATLPNKKVEIVGWVGDEEEGRSASVLQGQKALQHQPRTNSHLSSNLGGGSLDKVLVQILSAVFILSFFLRQYLLYSYFLSKQGKPMESASHQFSTVIDKSLPDRLSAAPNAYPSTNMHKSSTDLQRKSADGTVLQDDNVS